MAGGDGSVYVVTQTVRIPIEFTLTCRVLRFLFHSLRGEEILG